jgi:hypothetical protein
MRRMGNKYVRRKGREGKQERGRRMKAQTKGMGSEYRRKEGRR